MGQIIMFVILFFVNCVVLSGGSDVFFNPVPNQCPNINMSGVDYILYMRGRDYGWKEHTHRANIALAVNGWPVIDSDEMTKMQLQLEEEIIKALLKNRTARSNENDLAMFIHALIATSKNPWDFHGLDLVGDLLHRVENDPKVHPFLVLALCNSHAVAKSHLRAIQKHLELDGTNPEDIANKAIALKAFACARTLPYASSLDLSSGPFKRAMDTAVKFLVKQQKTEGKFGNVYTTSLIVQALTAYGASGWDEGKAESYLRGQSTVNVNLLQAYYIELALNAQKVKCLKDLYGSDVIGRPTPDGPFYFTTYSIVDDLKPDVYFTVYMKIQRGWNFFQVMEKAKTLSDNFKFSYVLDKNNKPSVYEVIGKPNDAEQNYFWTICRQSNVNHDPHTSEIETHTTSPIEIEVKEREHYSLRYRSTSCPKY